MTINNYHNNNNINDNKDNKNIVLRLAILGLGLLSIAKIVSAFFVGPTNSSRPNFQPAVAAMVDQSLYENYFKNKQLNSFTKKHATSHESGISFWGSDVTVPAHKFDESKFLFYFFDLNHEINVRNYIIDCYRHQLNTTSELKFFVNRFNISISQFLDDTMSLENKLRNIKKKVFYHLTL